MSYIMRDENGGERVIAPWGRLDIEGLPVERFPIEMSPTNEPTGWDRLGGLDPLGDRSELIRTTGGGGRKGFLGLGGRYPTWEHTYDTDTGISTIDTEGYGTRRYRTVTDADGYMREEMIPDFSPMLSEEETNQRKWGLLNSVVDAIKSGAKDFYERRPEVERDLQGNIISETGVNENLLELYRNRPDLLRK